MGKLNNKKGAAEAAPKPTKPNKASAKKDG
jgi:hypothetical protein